MVAILTPDGVELITVAMLEDFGLSLIEDDCRDLQALCDLDDLPEPEEPDWLYYETLDFLPIR